MICPNCQATSLLPPPHLCPAPIQSNPSCLTDINHLSSLSLFTHRYHHHHHHRHHQQQQYTRTQSSFIHRAQLKTPICCCLVVVVVNDQQQQQQPPPPQQSLWLHMLPCHRHLSIKSTLSRRAHSKESKRNRKAPHVIESITTLSCNRYLCLKMSAKESRRTCSFVS